MKFAKSVTTLAVALGAAGACLATTGTAAAASWDHVWTSTDANPGATVYIREYGDVVRICDTDADGYYAYVGYNYKGSDGIPVGNGLSASGNGNCNQQGASTSAIDNIPENENVTVTVGLGKSGQAGLKFSATHTFLNDH
ncbi:hypothetical protein [Amycolatopsis sp.]|uniref:hypothetical protein n=1 Tax=Amycolatopsis sp. TaxID=37632 RepID=UPI002BEF1B03|nr:hypothetical protein [Amycolatopsis sp.]HVV09615.1 hypothetical protein [Amycolatopsis sp.]